MIKKNDHTDINHPCGHLYYLNIYYSLKNRALDLELISQTLPIKDMLSPGYLPAHERFYLMLLRSRPDMVRKFSLRKTQTSTPSFIGLLHNISPSIKHPPAIADFTGTRRRCCPRCTVLIIILIFTLKVN